MTQKLVSRAIIYDAKGNILLARRIGNTGHGQWALVGGKPEGEEAPTETIIREVKEETNLVFRPMLFKEELDTTTEPGVTWKVSYFSGTAQGTLKLHAKENSEAQYFPLRDLAQTDIAFGHRRILEEFFASRKQ